MWWFKVDLKPQSSYSHQQVSAFLSSAVHGDRRLLCTALIVLVFLIVISSIASIPTQSPERHFYMLSTSLYFLNVIVYWCKRCHCKRAGVVLFGGSRRLFCHVNSTGEIERCCTQPKGSCIKKHTHISGGLYKKPQNCWQDEDRALKKEI